MYDLEWCGGYHRYYNALVCLCMLGHHHHPRCQCGERSLEAVQLGDLSVHEVQTFRMVFRHLRELSYLGFPRKRKGISIIWCFPGEIGVQLL